MSSKRPSLAGFTRPKPGSGTNSSAADHTSDARRPAAQPRPATSAGDAGPVEDAMHAMTVRISKKTSKALKIRSIDEERPVVDLIRDAIDDYLRRHRG